MNDIDIMTHEQAVSMQAAERYLLGQLTEEERSAFEAHYFDCASCFEQVQLGQDFMHHAHEVFSAEEKTATAEAKPGWLARIFGDFRRPAMAFVTAMLVCAVGIGVYQQTVISNLKEPRVTVSSVVSGEARGSGKVFRVSRNTELSLRVEFVRKPEFVSYRAQIITDSGKVKYSVSIPTGSSDDSLTISVPADSLDAGKYILEVYGVNAAGAQEQAGHGSFELQFTN